MGVTILPKKFYDAKNEQNELLQQIATSLGVTAGNLQDAINIANQASLNAQNKITELNANWNLLTTAQQQNAEVVTARQSTVKNKTFASLDARLEAAEQDLSEHQADIVQTDEVNSSEKYPSSAVTYVHGQRISKIENDLKRFSVVLKNYILASNETYEFSKDSSSDIFLITTHQDGVAPSLRSAHLVFCAISGYNGSVVTLAPSPHIEIEYENDKVLITNTSSTFACLLSIIKLF